MLVLRRLVRWAWLTTATWARHHRRQGGAGKRVMNSSKWWYGPRNYKVRSDPSLSVSSEPVVTKELPLITIVTRSGFRPSCLNNLQASIAAQNVSNVLQIVSNDARRRGRTFLEDHQQRSKHEFRIVDLDRSQFWAEDSTEVQCASSKYLNLLYREVPKDSWVMTLDDDSRLVRADQIRRVQRAAYRADAKTDVLLQDAYMWLNRSFRIYPNYTEAGTVVVDTSNFIFHQSAVKHLDFGAACGGDKVSFRQLLDAGYKPLAIRQPTPGVWGNYAGPAKQRLVTCDVHGLAPFEAPLVNSSLYKDAIVPASKHQHVAERYFDKVNQRHDYQIPKAAQVW